MTQTCGGTVHWFGDTSSITTFAKATRSLERFIWSQKESRNVLDKSIYNRFLAPKQPFGMPSNTLGIDAIHYTIPPAVFMVKMLPIFSPIFGAVSAYITQQHVIHSSHIGFITVPRTEFRPLTTPDWSGHDHLIGGRATARLWLSATHHNLVFQPLYTFVTIPTHEQSNGFGKKFSNLSAKLLPLLKSKLPDLDNQTLVYAFRIGYPLHDKLPTHTTPRMSVAELTKPEPQ